MYLDNNSHLPVAPYAPPQPRHTLEQQIFSIIQELHFVPHRCNIPEAGPSQPNPEAIVFSSTCFQLQNDLPDFSHFLSGEQEPHWQQLCWSSIRSDLSMPKLSYGYGWVFITFINIKWHELLEEEKSTPTSINFLVYQEKA